MNQLTKKQKLILLAILGVVLVAVFSLGAVSSQFKVVSIDPEDNGKIPTYGVIIFEFNQNVSKDTIQITTEPRFTYASRVEGKQLILTPSPALMDKIKYTVTLKKACAKDKTTACVTSEIHFTTDNTIPFNDLSKAQQKVIIGENDAEFVESPILSIMPVRETDFLIDSEPVGEITYVIITPNVIAKNLTEQEYDAAYSEYYQAGRKYLQDQGYALETSKYKVVSRSEYMAMW